ncbi:MAG: iron-sulfur cluster assembly accessory protein [Methylococcaceae bacterium]|nr:MAG: iron-sulfur cluster assembly accessory protein [Methylococcaceae bacterium]
MPVTLTENAAKQVKKQLANRGKGIGLKLGVKKSGCSGYSYIIDYADTVNENDFSYQSFGINIIVPSDEIQFIDGMELDYCKEGINEAFKFNNPNAVGTCGCGESFAVTKPIS